MEAYTQGRGGLARGNSLVKGTTLLEKMLAT